MLQVFLKIDTILIILDIIIIIIIIKNFVLLKIYCGAHYSFTYSVRYSTLRTHMPRTTVPAVNY